MHAEKRRQFRKKEREEKAKLPNKFLKRTYPWIWHEFQVYAATNPNHIIQMCTKTFI
jgi:hypothetical protein